MTMTHGWRLDDQNPWEFAMFLPGWGYFPRRVNIYHHQFMWGEDLHGSGSFEGEVKGRE